MPYVYRIERLCALATPITASRRDRFRVGTHAPAASDFRVAAPRCPTPQSAPTPAVAVN